MTGLIDFITETSRRSGLVIRKYMEWRILRVSFIKSFEMTFHATDWLYVIRNGIDDHGVKILSHISLRLLN